MVNKIRTDLALEARESFPEDNVEIKGVVLTEDYNEEIKVKVSTVIIKDEKGAQAMQKPIGTYITLEAPEMRDSEDEYRKKVAEEVAKHLRTLAGDLKREEILVVGLGNRDVTPDALGPQVVDNLFITRHLINEYGKDFKERHHLGNLSAISPGVMAQTGMEAVEIAKGIIKETNPKLVIVIDALASRSTTRVNTTIQLTDTGISPGSGVGNNRKALNEESLGVKVIAIGVPTVVDAATIVSDTLTQYMKNSDFDEAEIDTFISEVREQQIDNMFVTPKDIDESVKQISFTVSEAINSCFAQLA